MKKLIKRSLLLLFPFFIIVGGFIVADPMKIIYSYDSPLEKGVLMNDRLYQYHWIKNKPSEYNSFIFGSSRSKAFITSHWEKYTEAPKPFHMGVNDETLYGIQKKLKFLDQNGHKIDKALIIVDSRILGLHVNPSTHIFREHPELSGESYAEYYKRFFIAFLNPEFLKAYYTYYLKDKWEPWMNIYIWDENFTYIKNTGDHIYSQFEKDLKEDSLSFYKKKVHVFYDRSYVANYIPQKVIDKTAMDMLDKIMDTFNKHKTNYKLVISPTYDQKKLHEYDLKKLKEIFEDENVFDFSGVNSFSEDIGNFYEERHFKPYIADSIMKNIYQK